MNPSTFLSELKRRRVFRVAAAYAVAAFVVAQVADIFCPGLGLPEWSLRLVLVLLILGFSAALALAWAFDITPEGVVRTEEVAATPAGDGAQAVLPWGGSRTGRRLGALAGVGVLVLLAGGGSAYYLLGGEASDLSPNRVVVDAFVNRTGDPALDAAGNMAADWLVDGLQQIGGLDTSRCSSGSARASHRSDARSPTSCGQPAMETACAHWPPCAGRPRSLLRS